MKVHLNQIPPEGLHIEGEESADMLDLDAPNLRAAGPIRYDLDVGVSDGGLFATGSLALDLEAECGSCLEWFTHPLRIDDFAMQTELLGAETVDLTPQVREDTLLALPAYPRCDWNGKKVCQGPPAPVRPVAGLEQAATDWAALDQLNIRPSK